MNTREAKRLISTELNERGLSYDKLTARTVSFTDLARGQAVFVTVHGWKPDPASGELKRLAKESGFRVRFKGNFI